MTNDHRKRILEYQERIAAEQRDVQQRPDSQMKIPLIGEVRPPAPAPLARKRAKKPSQLQLWDV